VVIRGFVDLMTDAIAALNQPCLGEFNADYLDAGHQA